MEQLRSALNSLEGLLVDVEIVAKENNIQINCNHEKLKEGIQLSLSHAMGYTILVDLSLDGGIEIELINCTHKFSIALNQFQLERVRFTATSVLLRELINIFGRIEDLSNDEFTEILLQNFNILT